MLVYLVICIFISVGLGVYAGYKEKDFFIGACAVGGFYLFLGMLGYFALLMGWLKP